MVFLSEAQLQTLILDLIAAPGRLTFLDAQSAAIIKEHMERRVENI